MHLLILLLLSVVSLASPTALRYRASSCAVKSDDQRFDCFPDPGPNEQDCTNRGCCWQKPQSQAPDVPYCYFPSDFPTYSVTNRSVNGSVTYVSLYNGANIFRPNTIHNLTLEMYDYSNGIKRLRILDALKSRYEVPIPLFGGKPPRYAISRSFKQTITVDQDGHIILRSSKGHVLFSSTNAPLIYTDQFIEVTTELFGSSVYGIGELVAPFQKNLTTWQRYSLFTRDHGPAPGNNLYGVHPFSLITQNNGSAYGLFFLNSNAMDIDLTPFPAITFRTIGGIIDLFVFEGPSPADVISQYHSVIASPAMPPYWALGFHLCRWGYANDSELQEVIQRTLQGGFPYDVQWMDIDHMHSYLDWTVDSVRFANLSNTVNYLHSIGMHFVNIIDPGISNVQTAGTYAPYDDGHASDVFIKSASGAELIGQVWPGHTVYPDFTHPNASAYFYRQASAFRKLIEYDGLWLDMNEPSNFVDGSTLGCTNSTLDKPPYVPAICDRSIHSYTICGSAKQWLSNHYNLHSLYGYFETKAAREALLNLLPDRRPFLLSRSTYVGSQQFTAHWTGDISSDWTSLLYSIAQIMKFNLFGIQFTGADICGFGGDTTEELCVRWMQLGSFYPFMRNHNSIGQQPQDPGVFSQEAQAYIRAALFTRYSLLPYLYTSLFRAYTNGSVVSGPLFVAFPDDRSTYPISDQFLFGNAIMVSPVTQQNATTRQVYFPNATWYTMDGKATRLRSTWASVAAPLSVIPVHIRGGFIIALQLPGLTTEASRLNPFYLVVALDEYTQSARGELFLDDGETPETVGRELYSLITFDAAPGLLYSTVYPNNYKPTKYSTALQLVNVLGLRQQPTQVYVNGEAVAFKYQPEQILAVGPFAADLLAPLKITWA